MAVKILTFTRRQGHALRHGFRLRRARSKATLYTSHASPVVRAIANSIAETADHLVSPEEARFVERIEARRGLLLEDETVLEHLDFGAGSSSDHLPERVMSAGRVLMMPVCQITAASKNAFWGLFLLKLVRHLRPKVILEMGACVGVSTSYLAAGTTINGHGHLTTLEGSAATAKIADATLTDLNFANTSVIVGAFEDSLDGVLSELRMIDLVFIDGHHDGEATLRYFDRMQASLNEDAVVVFDDIRWSGGMENAWLTVSSDERVNASFDLGSVGIVLVNSRLDKRVRVNLPL